jgi:hypothetical protein
LAIPERWALGYEARLPAVARFISLTAHCGGTVLLKHDLFGKPDSTFPDHAENA